MTSYRMASSSSRWASRLSSAWRRSRWRLYVQTQTLTCHSRPSGAMSADGIGRLRRVTARDARNLAARVMNEPGWMIEQESGEPGSRVFPLAGPPVPAHGGDELLAVLVLQVSDALTPRPLCRRIAADRLLLRSYDAQR